MENKTVVAVGYYFSMFNTDEVEHINLTNVGRIKLNGEFYTVFKGRTFEDSEKVDTLMDGDIVELNLREYPIRKNIYLYDVTDYRLHMGDTDEEWDIDTLKEYPNFLGFADEHNELVRCDGRLDGLKVFDFNG